MRRGTAAFVVSATLAAGLTFPTFPTFLSGAAFPDDEKTIVHVLNRIGFGARPGDVERVRAIGLQQHIEQQLHPERIADASMSARLAGLETIAMSSREISERFEQPLLDARRDRRRDAAGNADPNAPREEPDTAQMRIRQQANGVLVELGEHKLLRAIYSERQLQEVLTDFWFNHFNVDARKGRDRFLLTEYERETIRPHVLGTFRELLGATAKSPAMLFYLDNWLSAGPNGPHAPAGRAAPGRQPGPGARGRGRFVMPMPTGPPRPQAQGSNNRRNGLNENYARELMELHTLGVDGGYTQKDVTEVARAFTGWTIDNPRQGGGFRFEPRIHDDAEKTILGRRIEADGGIADGEQVLDLLASHPSTARFISTKLARRFIADTPPAALVDRLAARFRATGGDLRAVMTTLLTSPEFLSLDAYRAKVKTPFEYVVSAVRATGAEVLNVRPLARSLEELGMPLYQCQPPTGYKDVADAWTSTGALVGRINFALALTSGRLPPPSDRGVAQDFSPARPGVAPGVVQDFGPAQPSVAPGVAQDFSPTRQSTPESIGALRRGRGVGPMATLGRGFIDRSPAALTRWEAAVEAALAHDLSPTTRATIARAATPAERVALVLGSPEFQKR